MDEETGAQRVAMTQPSHEKEVLLIAQGFSLWGGHQNLPEDLLKHRSLSVVVELAVQEVWSGTLECLFPTVSQAMLVREPHLKKTLSPNMLPLPRTRPPRARRDSQRSVNLCLCLDT